MLKHDDIQGVTTIEVSVHDQQGSMSVDPDELSSNESHLPDFKIHAAKWIL